MSDQVQLSAYSEAIENLIRSEQHDQAIALCQHILRHYPKNIETYRQMGVANLEKGDLHSAAELFRRVLSADPEDYVPYAGLAIIFERQALIDEAVWHLERAFELKPGNPEIRKELLRLYGERDGQALTRLRLTPGALARFYAREGLFAQAIQEFNAILSQAPRRQDARLALAETMWHAGQMRDSSQVCQEILQALPHCLKANLILGKAFQESGADQAEPYLRRAQALDPTNRVAQQMFGEQSPLDVAEPLVPQYAERSAPAPAVEAALAETGQARAESFDEWFAEEPAGSGLGGPAAPKESPIEGISTTRPPAPFEHWPPVQEEQAQVPPNEDAQSFSSSWVSQIQVSSKPTEFASAEAPSAEAPDIETSTNQPSPAAEEARPATQPRSPAPPSELPPWLLSDFGLAAPSQAAPKPTVSSASSLPPWLTEFQKTHEVDKSTEPATREAKPEIAEPLPEWTMEPLESTETAAPSPSAEEQTKTDQPWPSWEPVPPQAAEEASRSPEPPGSTDQLSAEQTVLAPEPMATKVPSEPAASGETGPAVEEEKQAELPDWLATTRVPATAAETDTTLLPAPEAETHPPIPDWLQGLQNAIPPETASLAEEKRAKPKTGEEKEQPFATRTQDELEANTRTELEAASPMPHAELSAESGLSTEGSIYLQEEETPEGGVQATPVTQPSEGEPEAESEPILLVEEPADRELYGDQTAAPAPTLEATQEPAAGETVPAPQANAPEESAASESLRRRRDPKGYSHLVQARTHCQDNRLGEALKEYDYLVQHSPRLVSAVIEDLEELVGRLEVPLEAHRILGDAYTRADRLADALERYRFVLERVS